MGASESTGRSNGTEKEEEEEQRRRQQGSGGGFKKAATALTIVAGVAAAAAAAWGISRLLSDDTDSQEKDDEMAIKADHGMERSLPNPNIRRCIGYDGENKPRSGFPTPPDRFRISNTDGGYDSTKGQSSTGYGGIVEDDGDYVGYNVAKQPNKWRPPPRGRFKMNIAAVSGPNHRSSAYAGILRNDRGEWVRGFAGFIGVAGVETAEIYAICKGIKLLDLLGLKASILEYSDSDESMVWINKEKTKAYMGNCSEMINECRRLAVKNNITFVNIYRDDTIANQCANKLADMALILGEKYYEIEEPPRGIKNLVDKDKESILYSGTKPSLPNPNIYIRGYKERAKQRSILSPPQGGFGANKGSSIVTNVSKTKKLTSKWSSPGRGRFKMNTDGACRPNRRGRGPSGYGGILRKDNGEFVCCFYEFIRHDSDGLTAELHGILKGLKLLERRGLKGSILETDCKAAFKWIDEMKNRPSQSEIIRNCWNIIMECRELVSRNDLHFKKIVGKHANRCADKLAAMAIKEKNVYKEIKYVPREIKDFVDKDKSPVGFAGCG